MCYSVLFIAHAQFQSIREQADDNDKAVYRKKSLSAHVADKSALGMDAILWLVFVKSRFYTELYSSVKSVRGESLLNL